MPLRLKNLILCLSLIVGSSSIAFSQNYLTAEQDVGFDIARTIVADAAIRAEPKYTSPVVTTFKTGYNLTLLNRKNVGGWYEVSDINSLKRGWINGNQITLYLSNGNFRQNAQAETQCPEPLYLNPDEDNGYDIVRMKPVWMTITKEKTGEKVGSTKVSVIMNLPEGSNPSYIAYDEETNLLLLSREPTPSGGRKVLDLEKGLIGTVSCKAQVYYTRKQKQDTESPFAKQRSSNSNAAPVTTIQNDADRDLTLFIDEVKYVIPSKSTKTITLSAGRHSYIANAPRVAPLVGSDVWEQGYIYTWTFYIVTRSR